MPFETGKARDLWSFVIKTVVYLLNEDVDCRKQFSMLLLMFIFLGKNVGCAGRKLKEKMIFTRQELLLIFLPQFG